MDVRWMYECDLECVCEIREESGLNGDIMDFLSDPDFICKVAECQGEVVGFVAYKNGRKRVMIKEMVVHPEFMGLNVEGEILDSVSASADLNSKSVEALVPEEDLRVQMAFKKSGFKAVSVVNSRRGTMYKFRSGVE